MVQIIKKRRRKRRREERIHRDSPPCPNYIPILSLGLKKPVFARAPGWQRPNGESLDEF